MDDTDQSELVRVKKIIEAEVKAASQMTPQDRGTVSSFRDALVQPYDTEVNFGGGTMQRCLTVPRTDGTYRVVYMPVAGYFSLCVESAFGPLDIGVHGPAMGCFASV